MATFHSDDVQAAEYLERIVDDVGIARVVYLLADIAEQQATLLAKLDAAKAARLAHDAKLLGRTAISLLN